MDLGWFETSLAVKDVAASAAFYEKLGFRQCDGSAEKRNITLQNGDCRLSLYQGHLDPATTQLIFWQGDVEAIAAELARKGVSFHVPIRRDKGGGASAMVIDPDGHPIFFIIITTVEREDPTTPSDLDLGWFELSLVTRDLAVTRAFYEKLGFRFVEENDNGRSVTLQNADCRITLFQDVLDPAETQLIFYQGDIAAIVRDLSNKGLLFEKGPLVGANGGTGALLRDPDGHPIYFYNGPGDTRKEPT